MVSAVLALLVGVAGCAVGAQQSMAVTGVRFDESFRLVGSVSSGLVVSVRIDTLSAPTDASAFALRIFDEAGKPSGELTVLAMRAIDDASPKTRWILLDGQTGVLERSYAALIKSGAAIIHKGRAIAIEKAGGTNSSSWLGRKCNRWCSFMARTGQTSRVFRSALSGSRGRSWNAR